TGFHSPPYVAGMVPSGDDAENLEVAGRFRALRLVLDLRDPAIARGEPDNNTGLATTKQEPPYRWHPVVTTIATCHRPSEHT
ncbi:hypothetical protein K525DRAFT_172174, partial [Schizophyllum commune Loenen D]